MSATGRGTERNEADFYATPAWCVERLFERLPLTVSMAVLEPCAGDGAIIRAANKDRPGWFSWYAHELREECRAPLKALVGGRLSIGDFLADRPALSLKQPLFDFVITNPPYSLALEFVEACLPLATTVAMLLRLNWFGSLKRAEFLREEAPDIYVLPNRPTFSLSKRTGKPGSDACEYGWFVWGAERGRRSGRVEMLATTPPEVIEAHKASLVEAAGRRAA